MSVCRRLPQYLTRSALAERSANQVWRRWHPLREGEDPAQRPCPHNYENAGSVQFLFVWLEPTPPAHTFPTVQQSTSNSGVLLTRKSLPDRKKRPGLQENCPLLFDSSKHSLGFLRPTHNAQGRQTLKESDVFGCSWTWDASCSWDW